MCYAKPGPRCASHLTTDIKKLETEIKELEKDSSDTAKFKLVQKRSRLDTYRFAYDGTQTGQNQLQRALSSMELDDPDYKDIKKYKDNARKEYDAKLRNFKEVEKLREERAAKKSDLLVRKARLEAELAALDSEPDDVDESPFAKGRAAAVSAAKKVASTKRSIRTSITDTSLDNDPDMDAPAYVAPAAGGTSSHAYGGKGGYSTGKGGSVASAYRPRASSPIGSTTSSYAYSGKGFGGK